jgi:hypothetical protein
MFTSVPDGAVAPRAPLTDVIVGCVPDAPDGNDGTNVAMLVYPFAAQPLLALSTNSLYSLASFDRGEIFSGLCETCPRALAADLIVC